MLPCRLMIPALTLRNRNGAIDEEATLAYAELASQSAFDYFMLSGSIGGGRLSTNEEKRTIVELWLKKVPAAKLLGCVWEAADHDCLIQLSVTPMFVLQELVSDEEVVNKLVSLPRHAFIYGHPDYTKHTLSPRATKDAVDLGALPRGCKLSKVSTQTIGDIRQFTGPDFELFDGRSRNIAASLQAGATGVAAVPFSILPQVPANSSLIDIQHLLDNTQVEIDKYPSVAQQAAYLTNLLLARLS